MTEELARLKEQRAAIDAEIARLKAEPDYERYREMVDPFRDHYSGGCATVNSTIRALLAARNHDPDVVALVRLLRRLAQLESKDDTWCIYIPTVGDIQNVLAPFAAIKDQ